MDLKEIFVDEEVVIHDNSVGLPELIDGLDVIFYENLAFILEYITVSQSMDQKEYEHPYINEVAISTINYLIVVKIPSARHKYV